MNSRKRGPRIGTNYIFNTIYQLLGILIPLITAPYLARVLGSEAIGTYSFAHSNVTYFVILAVFGTKLYGQNHIAICRENHNDLSRTFWEVFLFRVISSVICSFAYIVFLSITKPSTIIGVILIATLIEVPTDISWFFQGLEDFKTILMRGLAIRIVALICVLLFVKSPDDLWLYVLFSTALPILGNLWTWTNLFGKISYVKNIRIFRNIKEMWGLFLPTIAIQVYTILDKTMIGFITGSAYQNGCYEQAERIARVSLTVVTSIGAVILPRVANLYNNGHQDEAKDYVYMGFRFTWMMAMPMTLGLMMISSVFVPVFFGEGYDLALILLPIFSMLILFVSLAYVSGFSFLIPIGKRNIYTIAVSAGAGINLLLNLLLIPRFGAVGAAVASVFAEFMGLAMQIIYCCKNNLLVWDKLFKPCGKYIFASVLMAIVLQFERSKVAINVIGLLIMLITGACVYFISLIVIKDEFFLRTLKSTIERLRKRNET